MAKFKFAMENILRIKVQLEEQHRMALGRAMADHQVEKDVQAEIEAKLQVYLDDFYGNQKIKINASMLQQMSTQVSYHEKALKAQKRAVAQALDIVEIKREELKKALEERKIQEKLKENAFEHYQEDEKHKEQQLLDEVVGNRYATDKMQQ